MNRVVHFEFSAENGERAKAFFEKVFGWRLDKWEGGAASYWLVSTDGAAGESKEPGINGGMGLRSEMLPGIVNTINVEDVDAMVARVQEAGGTVAVPKQAIPGNGWVAYVKDTEGNLWGLYKDDPTAA